MYCFPNLWTSNSPFFRPAKGNDDYTVDRPSTYGEHYEVVKKIGEGSFGIIYEGILTTMTVLPDAVIRTQ